MKKLLSTILMFLAINANAQYTFDQIDIWSGSNGSSPRYITEFNGNLYFQAIDLSPSFKKLYKSDGTPTGTEIIAGNLNGGVGYSPESLYAMNGELYFTAFVTGVGTELYKTDGTDAGTVLLKDVRSGSSSGLDFNANDDNQLFVEYNGELYFRGITNSSIELWKTDGTSSGTISVKNFENAENGAPTFIAKPGKNILGVVYNGLLYFYVRRNGNGELWKTDGSTGNTEMVKSGLKNISEMIVFNNELYFVSGDDSATEGRELWSSDGTTNGTTIKFDIFPNNLTNTALGFGSNPSNLTIFNNELYFKARSYNGSLNEVIGSELWKTDGTSANLVKDIDTDNSASGLNIPNFAIYNNELYFAASDNTTTDFELWKTDGTEGGTIKVISTTDTGESIDFSKAISYANKLFYFDSQQLWVTDGTPSGTEALTGSTEEILQISTSSLVKYQNKLWLAGFKSGNGEELTSLIDNVLTTPTFNDSTFKLYPNPVDSELNLRFNESLTIKTIEIYNALGQRINVGSYNTISSKHDVKNLEQGVYFISVKTNNGNIQVQKFIKR